MALIAPSAPVLSEIVDSGSGEHAPQFRESAAATLRRLLLGFLYPLRASRLAVLPAMLGMTLEFLLSPAAAASRFDEPQYHCWQGLVGVSDDLSAEAILARYRQGLFPFCHIGPMKWWSPATRAVLRPQETHVEKNIRRLIRKGKYRVTFDSDFAAVMQACGEPRPGKTPLTWITPTIMRAFWVLHRQGHAHSVEVWDDMGRLVGGLYGLAVGNVFFGESQFARARDASKIAVATLHYHLAHWGFALRDAKWPTRHLTSLGFHTITRDELARVLAVEATKLGRVGRWSVDQSLDVSSWQTKT